MTSSHRALQTIVRWTIAFALVGLAIGVWAMFERVPPMAESGRKPTEFWAYAFWLPIGGTFGALAGCAVGIVMALASAGVRRIRAWLQQ